MNQEEMLAADSSGSAERGKLVENHFEVLPIWDAPSIAVHQSGN
jgi:hypothetical protein